MPELTPWMPQKLQTLVPPHKSYVFFGGALPCAQCQLPGRPQLPQSAAQYRVAWTTACLLPFSSSLCVPPLYACASSASPLVPPFSRCASPLFVCLPTLCVPPLSLCASLLSVCLPSPCVPPLSLCAYPLCASRLSMCLPSLCVPPLSLCLPSLCASPQAPPAHSLPKGLPTACMPPMATRCSLCLQSSTLPRYPASRMRHPLQAPLRGAASLW